LRALRILKEVKLIAAEDTRKTRRLLNAYDIKTPMTSYHEHSNRARLEYLLDYVETEDLALVSEAGMPGLSDPGYELIVAAIERGIQVVPVPGASAVIASLVVSGLPTDQFVYLGFLPRRQGQRQRLLSSLAKREGPWWLLRRPTDWAKRWATSRRPSETEGYRSVASLPRSMKRSSAAV